jgi:hypothetical protein
LSLNRLISSPDPSRFSSHFLFCALCESVNLGSFAMRFSNPNFGWPVREQESANEWHYASISSMFSSPAFTTNHGGQQWNLIAIVD